MKKRTFFGILICMFFAVNAFSQARNELNFGFIGANYEIPVHKNITIAPGGSTNFDLDWLTLNLKMNYYFDNLFGMTNEAWDVWGGIGAGYAIYNGDHDKDDDFDMGLQVGTRWFWNDTWGIYLEFGGGSTAGATGGLGLTVKL